MARTSHERLAIGEAITLDGRTFVVHGCIDPLESLLCLAYWGIAAVYYLKDPETTCILEAHLGQPNASDQQWPLWDFDTCTLTEYAALNPRAKRLRLHSEVLSG